MLVHLEAVMIFLAEEDFLAVEEDLQGAVAARAELNLLLRRRTHDLIGLAGHAHVYADRFVEIDDVIWMSRSVVEPTEGGVLFALEGRIEIDGLFRRIDGAKADALGVVKGTDQRPLLNEAILGGQVDFDPERFQ